MKNHLQFISIAVSVTALVFSVGAYSNSKKVLPAENIKPEVVTKSDPENVRERDIDLGYLQARVTGLEQMHSMEWASTRAKSMSQEELKKEVTYLFDLYKSDQLMFSVVEGDLAYEKYPENAFASYLAVYQSRFPEDADFYNPIHDYTFEKGGPCWSVPFTHCME
jgi:hypothetical protein